MVTAIPGMRGTGEFDSDFRPTNYRELYTFLEPNGDAPLNALLAMLGSEPTDDPKFNNFRDELPARTIVVDGAVASTSTTAVTIDPVADAGWVVVGTLLVNSTTGELMRATADGNAATGGIVVARNVGGSSHQIADAAILFIAGFAGEEGSVAPTSVAFDAVVSYNYTQIFKEPLKLVGTLKETYLRTGDKENELKVKALKLHMSDIERSMFFSVRAEVTGAGGQKLRTTGGLLNNLTNVTDVGAFDDAGVMDEDTFDRTLIEDIFAFGGKTKVAFVGATVAGHMLAFGKNRWQPQSIDGSYGIMFTQYKTPAGTLMVSLHPQFRQLTHMASAMVIIDTEYLKYRFMKNRDTMFQENIQDPDEDAIRHQYMTECGLELLQDKVHTYIKGWTAVVGD